MSGFWPDPTDRDRAAYADAEVRPFWLAPKPIVSASSTTTSRAGSSAFACSAAHRPVNPPPTMHRSASTRPRSGGCGARAGRRSSQYGRTTASA